MDDARDRVGLCKTCAKVKVIESAKGSTFYLCNEPSLPKYPQLPKRQCAAHVAASPTV